MNNADITLSIIIPTTGRECLEQTLCSLEGQGLTNSDEVLVVSDNEPIAESRYANILPIPVRFLSVPNEVGDWGAKARNYALTVSRGSHVYYLDDDDECLPGGITNIRSGLRNKPDVPHIFRMVHQKTMVLWQSQSIHCGNVSTQMFVHPNNPKKTGVWTPSPTGDLDFISSTVPLYNEVVWDRAVIAEHNAFR